MRILEPAPAACMILVHGLGRSNRSMTKIAHGLTDQGYLVINPDYPSTRADIDTLSRNALAPVVVQCRGEHPAAPIHFYFQSIITLPDWPERITSKACLKSSTLNRWVITGDMSSRL